MTFFNAHTHHNVPGLALRNVVVGRDAFGTDVPGLFSLGIHPWYAAEEVLDEQLTYLREWATYPTVRAIGECGLDRLRGPSLAVQQRVFEAQIGLSESVQKSLIIHCVRAFDELLGTFRRTRPTQAWVLHGVNNRLAVVQPLIEAGLYLSFGAALLRADSPARQVLLACPPNRVLLETDDSPAPIDAIYQAAADTLGTSVEVVGEQVWTNATAIFAVTP